MSLSLLYRKKYKQDQRDNSIDKDEHKPQGYPKDYQEKISFWRIFILASIVTNYLVTSFSYVFVKHDIENKIFYIILTLDLLFVLDYILALISFFWEVEKIDAKLQPTKNKLILFADFFLAFPYSYIYEAATPSYNYYVFLGLRAVATLRVLHLSLFFWQRWNTAGINHIKCFTIQYLTYLWIMIHNKACIWYISAFVDEGQSQWTKVDNFFQKYPSVSEKYIFCFYYGLTNTVNRNFGEISPGTTIQRLLLIVFICQGIILTSGVFIACLSFLLDVVHKRRTNLKLELLNLSAVLKPVVAIQNQIVVKNYYKTLWKKRAGVHESSQFQLLPRPLKYEICVDITINLLQTSKLFQDKPDAFLRRISSLVKYEFYQAGEKIYHRHVAKNKMIFVVLGTIEILSDEDDESPIVALDPGSCLGEAALLLTVPAKCSVRAASYTELQTLHRKDFLSLIELFPQVYDDIRKLVLRRVVKIPSEEEAEEETIELNHFYPKHKRAIVQELKNMLLEEPQGKSEYLYLYRLTKSSSRHEDSPCLTHKFPWILHPDSSLSKLWEFCVFIVTLYISITYPYYIVFQRDYPIWFSFSLNFVDFFLIIDIVLILTTAIEEKDKIVTTFTEISQKRLLQFGFYLDFFSCVKTELFYWIWTTNKRFSDVLKLNRLLKTYRIVKLIRKLENRIEFNFYLSYVIKYVFYLLVLGYFFGALFYITTCLEYVCTEDGWFFTKLMDELKKEISITYTSNEILTSVYFALSCLTGLTPGDILPVNTTDMVLTIILMTFGTFTFSCCVAQSSALLTRTIKVRTDFKDTVHSVLKFMKQRNVDKVLIKRVRTYFLLQWKYDQASALKDQHLLHNVNKNIQDTLTMDEKMDTISNLSLFEEQNSDFLLSLATNTKTLILPPDEFVTYKGEILKILYIIVEGYCIRQFEKSYVLLGPKSYFGTMCLFSNVNSLCNVKTLTNVKLFYITQERFWKSASLFPAVATQFRATCDKFEILAEFKKITINPSLTNLASIEDETVEVQGSIINVLAYCKQRDERYTAPFREHDVLCWIQILMMPLCILPDGSFLKFWIMLRLVVAVFITILVPYQIIYTPYAPTLDKILFVMDVISYIDLYMMMFVGYYNSKNQLIIHPLKTASHYLKGKFVLDLIVCFPWEIIVSFFSENRNAKPSPQNLLENFHSVVRIIRMGQIHRLLQYFNHFVYSRRKINSNVLQVLKYLPVTVVAIHFWTTIWIANTCRYYSREDLVSYAYNTNFVKPDGLAHHFQKPLAMYCNEESWLDRSRFRNFTEPMKIYITSVYFCTGVLTLCGLGDITPHYLSSVRIVLMMTTFGILFIGYIYAKIASHKAHWNCFLFKNQAMMAELKSFMIQENVSIKLQYQVLERFQYRWKRNKGVETNKILTKLHPILHQDIIYAMFERTLKNVPIFENVDRVFLRIFGKIIKERRYLRQEMIYRVDDVISDLCVIQHGVARVISKNGTMEAFLETGGFFGNITPNKRHKISVSVTAISNVDLIVMDSQEFYAALEKYPSIKNTIERSFTRKADFIIPSYKSMENITLDEMSYPETSASVNTFTSLIEFRANVVGCLLVCLPWKLFRVAIPHYSVLFTFFDIYCLVLAFAGSLFATYEFAFQDHAYYLLGVTVYKDVTFIVKIILEMHKTYENEYGELVTSNTKILEHYFKRHKLRRSADFLVNLPFYYIVFLVAVFIKFDTFLCFSSLRLIVVCRLWYFFDYYKEKSDKLSANRLVLKICGMIVWGTLAIHFFACGWYLCACPISECFDDSWVNKHFNMTVVDNSRIFDLYVTSVYFAITILTRTGTGDIVAYNIQEQIYTSVMMISSIFLVGIFIGEIWNFLNSTTVARVTYDYNIAELKEYVKNNKISEYQMTKLWKYVRQLWSSSKGHQMPPALNYLHSATRQQLMFEIYGHHLTNSYIFSEVEESFTKQLCQHFKRIIFFPGNYIVQHGDFDDTMYFIHYGEVDILSVHSNLTETVHEVLRSGDTFGVIQGLYHEMPHHFSFRARTNVHVVGLKLGEWEQLLDFFPESKQSIFVKTNRVNV